MKIRILTLALGCLATACTMTKKTVKSDIETIRFGRGGGVTGAVTAYVLQADGSYGKEDKNQDVVKLKTLTPEQTRHIFEQAQKLKTYEYRKPGNVYLFLELKDANGSNNIVWTMASRDIDSNVVKLHNELSSYMQ